MSLLAIVLAIGIVVDDAIVVVENVERVMEEHPELSPAEATKRAMAEITAPIIAITLVLLSVFVPVAFIPGISGELFRQFAVTVAVSMFLSAINALTLSPALCGVLLQPHHGPRRGADRHASCAASTGCATPMATSWRAHRPLLGHRPRHGRRSPRPARSALLRVTPTGFLPEDDQGAFFVVVQLPGGASVGAHARRGRAGRGRCCKNEETVADYTSVVGLNFIDNYSQPNAAFIVVTLKPFEERKDRIAGVARDSSRGSAASSGRSAAARSCRWRRRRSSASAPAAASPMCSRICAAAIRRRWRRSCAGSSSRPTRTRSCAASSAPSRPPIPSIYLDIDRDKAQILGVPLNNVFQALQASLGGYYVNDVNLFGRTWQVQVQAEAQRPRARRRHLPHQCAQRRTAKMIPLRSLVEIAGRRRPAGA